MNMQADHIEIKQPKATSIVNALPQKSIFQHFHVKGVLANLSETQYHNCGTGET